MKYNRADLGDTGTVAALCAEKDGRLRFVYATAEGYKISLKNPRLTFQDYFCFGALSSGWSKITYDHTRKMFLWDKHMYMGIPLLIKALSPTDVKGERQ